MIFKVIFIFFILTLNLYAGLVKLSAIVEYKNSSNKDFKNIKHAFTIPTERFYQKLVEIKTINISQYIIKPHDISLDYIEFSTDISKNSNIKQQVDFIIEIKPQYLDLKEINKNDLYKDIGFLNSTEKIQIHNKQIKAISELVKSSNNNLYEQLLQIFSFPSHYLNYEPQDATSALDAIKTAKGDCTEYSFVFVALARLLGIPSRQVAVFNFANKNIFAMPNHHIAEIYIKKYGWIPVYPNLSLGNIESKYSPGNIVNDIIVYKDNYWTWSSNLVTIDKAKLIERNVYWKIENYEQ